MTMKFARQAVYTGLISLFLAPLLLSQSKGAQDEKPLAIRISSEVVLVDLIATRDGEFVADLTRDQISVFQDGKKQDLTFFELFEVAPEETAEEIAMREPNPLPTLDELVIETATDLSRPQKGTQLIFLLDLETVGSNTLGRVKESIADFLAESAEKDDNFMLAVIRGGLEIVQPFTRNSEELLATLAPLTSLSTSTGADIYTDLLEEAEKITSGGALRTRDYITRDMVEMIGLYARELLVKTEQQLARTSEGLMILASYLKSVPGRKHIVFYSEGAPLDAPVQMRQLIYSYVTLTETNGGPYGSRARLQQRLNSILGGASDSTFAPYLEQAVDVANNAQVSIYAVDARGLVATVAAGEATRRGVNRVNRAGGKYQRMQIAGISESQQYLRNLAIWSGGRAFLNNNNLQRGADRAYLDSKRYYLIGYVPERKKRKGQFHKIDVKVERPDLDLRFRQGFYDTEISERSEDEIQRAIQFPSLFQSFPIAVQSERRGGKYALAAAIPIQEMRFTTTGEKFDVTVELYGFVVDGSGKLSNEKVDVARRFRYRDLTRAQMNELIQYGRLVVQTDAPLPPNARRLLLVIRQSESGRISTVFHDLD